MPIKSNKCPYCGAAYTLQTGGCVAKCRDMEKHHAAVSIAATCDPGELGEPPLPDTEGMRIAERMLTRKWRALPEFQAEGVRFIELEALVKQGRAMMYIQQLERHGAPAGSRHFFRINDMK